MGMSRFIGISTAALLFALCLLHVNWATGGRWGDTPLFEPPPAGTLPVATRGAAFAWWDTWLYVPLGFLLAVGCLVVVV